MLMYLITRPKKILKNLIDRNYLITSQFRAFGYTNNYIIFFLTKG